MYRPLTFVAASSQAQTWLSLLTICLDLSLWVIWKSELFIWVIWYTTLTTSAALFTCRCAPFLEVSSRPPPPSSALVWVGELIPPWARLVPSLSGPVLRISRRNLRLRSSWQPGSVDLRENVATPSPISYLPSFLDHMSRLQQILGSHRDVVILVGRI